MKKEAILKRLSLILGLMFIFNMQIVNAGNITTIGNLTYQLFDDGTAEVGGSSKTTPNIVIPAEITYNDVKYPVTSIGRQAFYQRTELTSITIPNSVTGIRNEAFYGCTKLTSVIIPNNVTGIGISLFADCTSLTSATLSSNITVLERNTFYNCTSLTSVTIPNGITTIATYAFQNCIALTSIAIPKSVIYTDAKSFGNCTNLKEFVVCEDNPKYTSIEGVLFNKEKTILYAYPYARSNSYTIPEGVETIMDSSFENCSNLTTISMPNSVRLIGAHAFMECTELETVIIPGNVTSINFMAFGGCTKLKNIYSLNVTPPACELDCFEYIDNNAVLHVPNGYKAAYETANVWKDFKNIQEIGGSSISGIYNETVKVHASSDRIIIENAPEGENIQISNLSGQTMYQGTERELFLNKGTYIVKAGNTTQKVVIK